MSAPKTIEIKGKIYNKCYIGDNQYDNCLTPCAFCSAAVTEICNRFNTSFCEDQAEHVCYINLAAIYGEEINEL